MTLEKLLISRIAEEAKKLEQRFHAYHNALELEFIRKSKRVSNLSRKEIKHPECWLIDNKFNPFYVYKHRRQIAHPSVPM